MIIRKLTGKAFEILRPGIKLFDGLIREIRNRIKKVTAPYKYPKAMEFADSLSKTVSGKIKRNELREREIMKCLNGNNIEKKT